MWSSWILCGFLIASELAFPQGDTLNVPILQMRKLRLGKGKSFDSIHRTWKRHNQNRVCLTLSSKTLCDGIFCICDDQESSHCPYVARAILSHPLLSFSSRSLPISTHPILGTHSILSKKYHPRRKFPPLHVLSTQLFMGDIICPVSNDSKWGGMGVLKIRSKLGTSMQR